MNQTKNPNQIRLNKFIASCGITSRRKADELIVAGKIKVNGQVVTELGSRIDSDSDVIEYDGKIISEDQDKVYIVLNKPKNVITTVKDEFNRKNVTELIEIDKRIFPVGRLDYDTTGVLLLTNDGDLANMLIHPSFKIKKKYWVLLDKVIKPVDLYHFQRGIELDGKMTSPCSAQEIRIYDNCSLLEVTIQEGRNRQIRNMFEVLGYEVQELDRVEFAGLGHGGMKKGEWRILNDNEISELKNIISKKTE